MLVFINVDSFCKIFRKTAIIFEEVIIILCLFICYQPQFFPKSNFSHKSVILKIDHFDL